MPKDVSALRPAVCALYLRRVAAGEIQRDARQLAVAAALDRVAAAIAARPVGSKSGALGWLLGRRADPEPVRGLYIHGGVGRGKTMLMDMFFAAVPWRLKRRVHFNDFMADAHDRIAHHRLAVKDGSAKGDDPIPPVAADLAAQATVLCFDEFSVTDIADAMILSRLFAALFDRGVVLVATSNVAPDDLYRNGLNRALFLPFLDLLKRHADIAALDGALDYRMRTLSKLPVYLTPDDSDAALKLDQAWAVATAGHAEAKQTVAVMGRTIAVPRAAGRAARFTFADLCAAPLAARDYIAVAERFDTIFIEHVPVIGEGARNEAKRFILLIDTLYDRRIRLIMTAATEPAGLYAGRTGTEAFEFARTVSRLNEMQDKAWPPKPDARQSEIG